MNGDADKPGIEFIEEPDLPLSTVQTGILAEQWIAPTTTRYNVPIAFAIKGELD